VEWRRLHNKELYALNSSPDIIRVMKSVVVVVKISEGLLEGP
jgi:hypothetical protein